MKFRTVNIIFALVLVLLIPVHYFIASVQWWYIVLIAAAYITIVFAGCIKLSLNFFVPVLCHAETSEKTVALSFDDGPHPLYSPQILDTLKKCNVQASFFCIGKNIQGNETILRRINDEGHITGNHSYSHDFLFDMFGTQKMLVDMQQMDNAVTSVTGVKPALFRPPYGVMNPNLAKAIKKGNYLPVGWSIRSFDTTIKDREKLLSRIMKRLKSGDIILLHDTMEITAGILPELIEKIKSKGFSITRLDKMLNVKAYA
jgi:peptidoglycan/xylan/chitin deacetylase (PgdA/CDA1 family)